MSVRRLLYRSLFAAGITIFGLACLGGIASSLVGERRLPGISQEYGTFVHRLFAERRFERAAREMQMALRLDHMLPKGQAELVLAQSLSRSGQRAAAIPHYRAAIAAAPQSAVAHAELGGVLALEGDFEAAAAELRRALEIDPQLPDVASRLAWAEGSVLRARGQLAAAAARFRAALAARPDLVEARYDLGATLVAAGQAEDALREFREIVRMRPDARGFNALGMVLVELGRSGEAADAFRQGLALAPQDVELRRNLSRVAATSGEGR
jgi:tetratricopeptide (TPR) repeat protein